MGIDKTRVSYTPLLHLFMSYRRSNELDIMDLKIRYDPFLLFFGRLEKYKGIDTLLEAHEIFSKSRRSDDLSEVRLVLAGPGTIPPSKTISLPSTVEFRNRLIQDGESMNLFSNCSLVVLPYSDATQSSLIASAYYFSKSVIVTRTGALPEYVERERTGYVVEPNNPIELADAFRRAMDDPENLRAMGSEARKWYDNRRFQETQALFLIYQSLGEA
jgi:glycosyltransferase involved in cell wall biosynthesis